MQIDARVDRLARRLNHARGGQRRVAGVMVNG
jgi:hypothetical protein